MQAVKRELSVWAVIVFLKNCAGHEIKLFLYGNFSLPVIRKIAERVVKVKVGFFPCYSVGFALGID